MTDSPVKRAPAIGIVAVALLLASLAVGIGLAPVAAQSIEPSLDCVGSGGGPAYVTDSGLTVYENDTEAAISTFYFPDSQTVRFGYVRDALNVTAAGPSEVRLENGTGATTCLGAVNATSHVVTVAPDDENAVTLAGTFEGVSFRDVNYTAADADTDLAYAASQPSAVTVHDTGLANGTTVVALDAESGVELDNTTVETGAVTFTDLPVGTHNVDLKSGGIAAVNVTVGGDPTPTFPVGEAQNVTVSVVDFKDDPIEGVTITVDDIDDGDDNVTVNGLSVSDIVVTDAKGEATFTGVSFEGEAGATVDVTVSTDDGRSHTVTVTLAVGDPASIDATTTIDEAVADGVDEVEFTVTITDAGNNPVEGETVTVEDDDELGGIDTGDRAQTDAAGEATFTATSTTASEFTVEFSHPDGVMDTATATFVAGEPDSVSVTTDVDQAVANGNSEIEFTVSVVDAHDNPVEGVTVEVRDSGGLDDFADFWITGMNGQAIFTATSTDAGEFTVTFEEQDQTNTATATVTFVVGGQPVCNQVEYSIDGEGRLEVGTVEELQCIGHADTNGSLADDYVLVNDIDLGQAGVSDWNGGDGFEPIGSELQEFMGTFDGQGHTISNLTIDRKSEENVGLFGVVSFGRVKSVTLESIAVSGGSRTGGLIGKTWISEVTDVTVTGTVTTSTGGDIGGLIGSNTGNVINATADVDLEVENFAGGLIGWHRDGTVVDSIASGTVNGRDSTGGLVGATGGVIVRSQSMGDVHGHWLVGGLVGQNNGEIRGSIATGDVDGDTRIGGLSGSNGGQIDESYATGAVDGNTAIAGLIGENRGQVNRSYATGPVDVAENATNTGGLIGNNNGTLEQSFWDTNSTGQDAAVGTVDSTDQDLSIGGTGLSTAEMQRFAPLVNMDSFDFEGNWTITEGYPRLAWEGVGDITVDAISAADATATKGEGGVIVVTAEEGGTHAGEGVTVAVTNAAGLSGLVAGETATTDENGEASFSFEENATGEYTVSFAWTDDPTVNDTATITITELNARPTADAGADQTTIEDNTVTLNGTGSSDPDDDPLNYSWTQTTGPTVALQQANSETPAFIAPDVADNTTLTFQLTVSDGNLSDTDTVTITVRPRLQIQATALSTEITDEDDLEINVSITRGGEHATATLYDATDRAIATTVRTLVAGDNTTFTFSSSLLNAADGPYYVEVTINQTSISNRTEDIGVSEAPSADSALDQTIITEDRGDVVEIPISLVNTDTATVTIGTVADDNYQANVTIEDGDGDGTVRLLYNTYTAGSEDVDGVTVFSTADRDDSIRSVDNNKNGLSGVTPVRSKLLTATDYEIQVVAGTTPAPASPDGADTIGTLSLQLRSTNDLTMLTAPGSREAEIRNKSDVYELIDDGNITQTATIAEDDLVIHAIEVSGLEGVLSFKETDGNATSVTDAFNRTRYDWHRANGRTSNAEHRLSISQTNAGANLGEINLPLNGTTYTVVPDYENNTYYVVYDLRETAAPTDGDKFESSYTVLDFNDLASTNETVNTTWTFQVPDAQLDTNADIDHDGSEDDIVISAANDQVITGDTNLAPGTRLTVRVRGTDSSSPFLKDLTTRVQPNGTFIATGDFNDNAPGVNFTVTVRSGGTIISDSVDGRFNLAPSGTVTFADQVSNGTAVTVTSVTSPDGGFVAIHDGNASGPILGSSSYLTPGRHANVTVTFDESVTAGSFTLVAIVHEDSNGNQSLDFPGADSPYVRNGSPVADAATVTVQPRGGQTGLDLAPWEQTAPLTSSPVAGIVRTDAPVSDISIEVVRNASSEYSINITAPESATNVTFYLQTIAFSSRMQLDDLRMFLDGETQPFELDPGAGRGGSPWVGFEIPSFSTRTVTFTSANLSVTDASLDRTTINTDQAVNVSATVANSGNTEESGNVSLIVNETIIENQTVTVMANSNETIYFVHTFQAAGTFEVVVNDVSAGNVTVEDVTTVDDGQPGFGVGVAVLAVLLAVLSRRSRE